MRTSLLALLLLAAACMLASCGKGPSERAAAPLVPPPAKVRFFNRARRTARLEPRGSVVLTINDGGQTVVVGDDEDSISERVDCIAGEPAVVGGSPDHLDHVSVAPGSMRTIELEVPSVSPSAKTHAVDVRIHIDPEGANRPIELHASFPNYAGLRDFNEDVTLILTEAPATGGMRTYTLTCWIPYEFDDPQNPNNPLNGVYWGYESESVTF